MSKKNTVVRASVAAPTGKKVETGEMVNERERVNRNFNKIAQDMSRGEAVERVARICHEANRGYCEALGDTSQVPWDEAPENIKFSAIAGVKFHAANPSAGPGGKP